MCETDRSPLRLLFISSDTYPPFRVDVSVLFGRELVGRGHRIDWLLQSSAPCRRAWRTRWEGGEVWVGANHPGVSPLARVLKHWRGIRNDLRMFFLARRTHYDFIQVKDKFLSALAAILVARLTRTPFVYWLSYPFPEESLYKARTGIARYPVFYYLRGKVFHLLLYRVILPAACHVFVQSERMGRDLERVGVPPDKMSVVPMGVDLARIPAPLQAERGRVVYLGSLARLRQPDFLLRVHARVVAEDPGARLYLVGGSDDPGDLVALELEARRLGIAPNVHITGNLPMHAAWEFVRTAQVCLSICPPSPVLQVGSPTKLVEYMALARPVVANEHPEQCQVLKESGAGVCVPFDETAVARAVLAYLRDSERCAQEGAKGRRYVREWRDYRRIAGEVEQCYLDLRLSHAPKRL